MVSKAGLNFNFVSPTRLRKLRCARQAWIKGGTFNSEPVKGQVLVKNTFSNYSGDSGHNSKHPVLNFGTFLSEGSCTSFFFCLSLVSFCMNIQN